MATLNVDNSPNQLIYPPGFPVLAANTDIANPVYISTSSSPSAADAQIPPLGSVSLDGSQSWYARTTTGGTVVQLAILPGATQWTPSPYQVAEQLSALGLALNSTLETTNTTLGTPAQTGDVITTLPANIQAMGAPPYVPSMKSAGETQMSAAGSPYTLVTFGAASRVWYLSLNLSAATESGYSAGLSGVFAQVQQGTDVLLACQVAVGAAGVAVTSDQNFSLGGLEFASGDVIEVNINNGNSITDVFIRAAAVCLYTTP